MSQHSVVSVDKGWWEKRREQMFIEFLLHPRHWSAASNMSYFICLPREVASFESRIFKKLKCIEWKMPYVFHVIKSGFAGKWFFKWRLGITGILKLQSIHWSLCYDLEVLYQINNFVWCPEHSWGSIEKCNESLGHCFTYRISSVYHLSFNFSE